jgi:hypothetical protein
MHSQRTTFADWLPRQGWWLGFVVRFRSRLLRLKLALPVLLFVLIPAMCFAVAGAASVKWLPGMFNYSCVQATPSLFIGLFHSAPSGILVGGGIILGLTLYRLVFGKEYDPTSNFRPYPALAFGAVFGLIAGVMCVFLIAEVYQPEALQQMGWSTTPIEKVSAPASVLAGSARPPFATLFGDLFVRNCCGYAFPINCIGLGIAMALMTNRLRASNQWPEFVRRQTTISEPRQLLDLIRGIGRVTLPFAWPILVLVPLFALLSLVILNTADKHPRWDFDPARKVFLGGLDASDDVRKEWKRSLGGRALGLFGDCLPKIVGGYLAIVGMGLGIVIMRHGVKISPQKLQG